MKTESTNTSACTSNCLETSLSKKLLTLNCATAIIVSLGVIALSAGGLLPMYASFFGGAGAAFSIIALAFLLFFSTPEEKQAQKPSPARSKPPPPRTVKPEDLLLPFYCGEGKDIEGRTFNDILRWDDGKLESQHNYIQWLFPLPSPSAHNRRAPVLSPELQEGLKSNGWALENVKNAFERMLSFYGLHYDPENKTVEKTAAWQARKQNWVTPTNHNFLRITRILRFLALMEMHEEKDAFFVQLQAIKSEENAISEATFRFWKNAAT